MIDVQHILRDLLKEADRVAPRSYAPYSLREEGVVILLESGDLIPGVRVENASFQLTIGALLNAITTMASLGRKDIAAIASTVPFSEADLAYTSAFSGIMWQLAGPRVLLVEGSHLPEIGQFADPIQKGNPLLLARQAADFAQTSESDFPVGATASCVDGESVSGCNVEHVDWSRILCAERNALGTVQSYGLSRVTDLYVSCVKQLGGSPCGACRQVIVEMAGEATIWIDMGDQMPKGLSTSDLLPDHFAGSSLRKG